MKPKTYHDGAAAERKAWIAKIRRELRDATKIVDSPSTSTLLHLVAWGQSRTARYNKRPGGLGRK